jgi:predicted N-formylglutamate amidohydrolase
MGQSSLGILQREGEVRGSVMGHGLDTAEFDDHVSFYKGALRVTRIFVGSLALLLVLMYFFLVR